MGTPKFKHITIASELELDVWLTRNHSQEEKVTLVTHTKTEHQKIVSREQVNEILLKHGWKAASRYTMGPDLLGHVIGKN